MGSCLPTVIQLPLILGLYQSVTRAMAASPYELFRLEQIVYPWMNNAAKLLPLENQFLWMNLGQPERINIFGLSIPFLAILVVATTYLQSKLIQPPSGGNDQAAMMSKSMSIYMPLLMGYMSYSLASGLALYFLTSNVFGIVQYTILGRSNWDNILPFLKKKEVEEDKSSSKKSEPVVVEAKDVPEPEDSTSDEDGTDKKRMPKRKRPKRKNS